MTKPTVRTAQTNMGNTQINTETLRVQRVEIRAMPKGDYLKRCIRPILPLGWPVLSQLQHRARDAYGYQCQTKCLCHQLWKNSRIILIISCDGYALLQTDDHSGSCAGPDDVSTQLREASLRLAWRTERGISSSIPALRGIPYSCSERWYPWLRY